MAQYVKIKKAKNLRFRLISVLYLLFISLSIIQIPIEWLRINPLLSEYLDEVKTKDAVSQELDDALKIVDETTKNYLENTGIVEETGYVNEPTSYSSTDQFFVNKKGAEPLFLALVSLKNYYSNLPKTDKKVIEFNELFEGDLKNGIESENLNLWLEWKFKHVPATVVMTLLSDIRLRLKLLNGAVQLEQKKENAKAVVKVAYNVDLLQLGDTARFILNTTDNLKLEVTQNGAVNNNYYQQGDSLFFVPKFSGKYRIVLTSELITDTINVNVLPAQFIEEKGQSVQYFYEMKPATLKFANVGRVGNLKCDCADNSEVKIGNTSLDFTPNKAGWCNFELRSASGSLLLQDSIYVQAIPEPMLSVLNASSTKIARTKFKQQGGLTIYAFHPQMDNFNYNIQKVHYRIIGIKDINPRETEGAQVKLNEDEISSAAYIEILGVEVEANTRIIKVQKPILIEVI